MGFGAVPQGVTRRLYCLSSLSVQLGLTNRLALKNPISAMIGCERFQLIPVSGPIFHFLDVAGDCRPTWQICNVGFLLSGMPLAGDDELGGCQFLQAARASGMKLVSADTNLGSQSKFPTIIKASACVNHDGGGIDLLRELPRRRQAGGDNRIGVVRTVLIDMGDRFFDRINRSDTDAGSQVLPIPVVFGGGGCMGRPLQTSASPRISIANGCSASASIGKKAGSMDRWITRDSQALQTPILWHLALTTKSTAILRSADAST